MLAKHRSKIPYHSARKPPFPPVRALMAVVEGVAPPAVPLEPSLAQCMFLVDHFGRTWVQRLRQVGIAIAREDRSRQAVMVESRLVGMAGKREREWRVRVCLRVEYPLTVLGIVVAAEYRSSSHPGTRYRH